MPKTPSLRHVLALLAVSALPLLLLTRALFAAAVEEQPHGEEVILYLASPRQGGLDSRAVADAVGVYTSDLRFVVQMVAQDPPAPSAAARGRLTTLLRTRRARFAFWCVPRPDGHEVGLYSVDAQGIVRRDVIPVNGPERPDLHRAIGLKVRAILKPGEPVARPAAIARSATVAVPAARDAPVSAATSAVGAAPAATTKPVTVAAIATPAVVATADVVAAPAGVAAPVVVARPAAIAAPGAVATSAVVVRADAVVAPAAVAGPVVVAGSSRVSGSSSALALMVAVDYCGRLAPLRQAVALQGIGRFGADGQIELVMGLDVASPATRSVPAGSISLLDIPWRLGGRLVAKRARFAFGVGLFGSVHLLSASATSADGAKAETLTAAGGGGVELMARTPSMGRFSGELRGWVEAIVPSTRFLVGRSLATETGRTAAGVAVGIVFPMR